MLQIDFIQLSGNRRFTSAELNVGRGGVPLLIFSVRGRESRFIVINLRCASSRKDHKHWLPHQLLRRHPEVG